MQPLHEDFDFQSLQGIRKVAGFVANNDRLVAVFAQMLDEIKKLSLAA
jgi:hypothetical protein